MSTIYSFKKVFEGDVLICVLKKSVQSVYWASKLVLFPLPFLVTIKWTYIFLIRKLNGLRENYLNVGHLCKTSPYKTAVVLCPIYNRLACYYRITFILVLCSYSCLFHIFKEEKKKHLKLFQVKW